MGYQLRHITQHDRGEGGNGTLMSFSSSILVSVVVLVLTLLFAPLLSSAASTPQGTAIVNVVNVTAENLPMATATSLFRVVGSTPAAIDFLQYSPNLAGAVPYSAVPGAYRAGVDPLLPFTPLPLPVTTGSSQPLNLSQPVPLFKPAQIHQGDALFIRVADPDQDLDSTVRDTIFVTITDSVNGDVEVVLLTETGISTGVFIGYLPTVTSGAIPYNGEISVASGQTLVARYVDPDDGTDTVTTAIMVDPLGIVFDSRTGAAVNGAAITLINQATGLPAAVFGDDGVSTYPSSLVSGTSASDSSGKVYTFGSGGYRFPYVQPGTYRLIVTPPAGYNSPSAVDTPSLSGLPGGPFAIVTGSRGEPFPLNPGPALRVDIPVDPFTGGLWLQKTAGKDLVGHGDFVPYLITIANKSQVVPQSVVQVSDTLPVGFRYRSGSLRINNLPAADPVVSGDGRTMQIRLDSIAAAGSAEIRYVAEVTAGATLGTAINQVQAVAAGGVSSNLARASVKVQDDFLKSRSILMGRISTGACNRETGEGPAGVEGMRVFLEDGTFVISDRDGLFHFEGVKPGLHVVQLDLVTLPKGFEAVACSENSRFAGSPSSQFVEVQGGTLWRTDFYVARKAAAATEPAAAKAPSEPTREQVTVSPVAAVTAGGNRNDNPVQGTLPEARKESAATQTGLLSLRNGQILPNPVIMVHVRIPAALSPRLLVDGAEVPADQIGMRSQDTVNGLSNYSYLGVVVEKPGPHSISVKGIDPFGNPRFSDEISVVRTGGISSIRLLSKGANEADGVTPVRIRVELKDVDGTILTGASDLELKDGDLKPLQDKGANLEEKATGRILHADADGWISFQPVTASGTYRIVIGQGNALLETEVYVKPQLRDWILVGLAEGTAGYAAVSGNMENYAAAGGKDEFYRDGRVAFYAKGQIKGEWLLTMSYDSNKTRSNGRDSLFQNINPDSFYTLYGDASQQGYDAASTQKIYVKIERDQFYAMFGDYDTGLTITELSRYSRRMTGGKTEYHSGNLDVTAFAAQTDQAYVRDDIQGDGTSGMYHLTRRQIVPNSEKITIEVRDRFRSEVVLSTRSLGRFTDYSIDYDTGAIFFKEPVYSRDDHFNPVFIVAEYESTGGALDYTYGGRAALKLMDGRIKTGFSHIHEGQGDRRSNLYGADTTIQLNDSTRLRGEIAATDFKSPTEKRDGMAYLAEVSHHRKALDVKAYYREQETGFGLGQQPAGEAGTRKMGVEGRYGLNDRFGIDGNLYRQYSLLSNSVRDVAEGRFTYSDKGYGSYLGFQYADDKITDGHKTSGQVTFGGRMTAFKDLLTMTVDHAQSVLKNDNSDFPTRTTIGAEFKAHRNLTLLGAQEFTWGKSGDTMMTRLGMRSAFWNGGSVTSTVERQFNENDDRLFATMGLKQTWQLNESWKLDAGLDRSQMLLHTSRYLFNSNVPPASGSSESFTAITTGATYQVKHVTWENRVEARFAKSEDKWGVLTGLVNEVSRQWAWSAKGQVMQTSSAGGMHSLRGNLRYGLVYRPLVTEWILLNRLDIFYEKQTGSGAADLNSMRVVNNLSVNYRPFKELQISYKYGAKYVVDTLSSATYRGFTDHCGIEARYDLSKSWDVGMLASILHSWHNQQLAYSYGPSVGYSVVKNVWLGLGYNVSGYNDRDFSMADHTAQGPYVRFRMKIDQQSLKDIAGWMNRD